MRKYPLWVIFKLFFFELINDFIAIIALIFLPILLSTTWILLTEYRYIDEVPDASRFSNPLTLWYDFAVFWIVFVTLIYFAIRFADLRRTALFRKILVFQISGLKIVFVSLSFFFLFGFFVLLIKFGLLMYYSSFRKEIENAQIAGLITGFLLLMTTSLSLGCFFATLPISSSTLNVLIFTLPFFLLFLAGFFINIENLLIFIEIKDNPRNWTKISEATKIYRAITYVSPFQPSLEIIKNGHTNSNWQLIYKIPRKLEFERGLEGIEFRRPMIYANYWTPILINLTWIYVINQVNVLLSQKTQR